MRTIREGSGGAAVKALQRALSISADGIFGPKTLAAVRQYQQAHGLLVDGIVGPKTWASLIALQARPRPVDFKQYDARWRNVPYSSHGDPKQTVASSGCGPTAFADILATWKDPAATPASICKLAAENGFRTAADGTSRAFFPFAARKYGFSQFIATTRTDDACRHLKAGALVVALMGPGYWTNSGHYICLYEYDAVNDRVWACDPASPSRKYASRGLFAKQARVYFIYYK